MKRGPLRLLNSGEDAGIGRTALLINGEIAGDYGAQFLESGDVRSQIPPAGDCYAKENIKAIIISHDHLDHIAALPRLAARKPGIPIYISRQAKGGGAVMLNDTLKVARNAEREALAKGLHTPTALFNAQELEKLYDRDITLTEPGQWIKGPSGYEFGFNRTGHNFGAQSTCIVTPDGWPILWTGDTCSHDLHIEKGVLLPDNPRFRDWFMGLPNRVMITEATNGARKAPAPREELERRFIFKLAEVLARGGSIMIPAFANNRSGEVISIIRKAMDEGLLPDVPVHVDGLAREMVLLQVSNADALLEQGKLVFIEYDTKTLKPGKAHREFMAKGMGACKHDQMIIVSSSADLRQGPSVFHASYIAEDSRNAILFPGYLFPGSPAKEIFNNRLQKGFTLSMSVWGEKKQVNIRCEVEHFELTAHDWQEGLVERVKLFKPSHLIVHHCSWEAFHAFKRAVRAKVRKPPKIYRAAYLKEIVITED